MRRYIMADACVCVCVRVSVLQEISTGKNVTDGRVLAPSRPPTAPVNEQPIHPLCWSVSFESMSED